VAIEHAKSGEVIDIAPFGSEQLVNHQSVALFKSKDLEVIRLVMQAKALMPLHHVLGEITIQCIEGVFEVLTDHGSQVVRQYQMLFLQGGEPHIVRAIDPCSILVTIALKQNQLAENLDANDHK